MDKLNLESLRQRIKAKTPPFWKQIRKLMLACSAVGATIAALPADQTEWLPHNTGAMLITVGAVGTALCSLTANPEIDPEQKNN